MEVEVANCGCVDDVLLPKGGSSRLHDAGPLLCELPKSFAGNLLAVWMVDGGACHPYERDFHQRLASSQGIAHPPILACASVLQTPGVRANAQ